MNDDQEEAAILGRWRIIDMEQWEQDFIDAEMPGFIRFDPDDMGEFHFGYVHGQMDCEQTEWDGQPTVEWSGMGSA